MEALAKVREAVLDVKMYWRQPRPGEYVPYREVVMLSVGWMAMLLAICWSITFGVGNEFTGMTLKMNNAELLVMSYISTGIGYLIAPLNAYIIDNLRSSDGKYRVYIKLALPSMILTLISLWLPYESIRDAGRFGRYIMIIVLFLVGQIQGYVKNWVNTGVTNMVHVMTPNTQERTKIMAITSIIYSLGYTISNFYFPLMVDVLCKNGDKYNMRYFRGAYTPLALLMPVVFVAYFGTRERLVLPKSRITRLGFSNSLRAVAGNKIFWIKCADGWNDFLEGAKGNIWEWMVYRAHIMKSTTYGLLNTVSYNANFWGMLFSPWFIKRFGKRNIKIFKNIAQIFLIASYFLFYKTKLAAIGLFIVYTIDRFVDTGNVIDSAIESDMRDNQQYLIGERIDGAFGLIQSYAGGAIGAVTGLFIPWVYQKKGFDGNDYSVLDVYKNYDETLPLSQQVKNPNCVLFDLMDTLLTISIVGAAIDVLPWFAYDISETGQKSMIRVIRIRTLIEDRDDENREESTYLEGCEAIIKARAFEHEEKLSLPDSSAVHAAKQLPNRTKEEKAIRLEAIRAARAERRRVKEHNEEVEISRFVMHELNRFETAFGQKQYELCKRIADAGIDGFHNDYEELLALAQALPHSDVKEERTWRKQEIKNAKQIRSSHHLFLQLYPDGHCTYDPDAAQRAYDMPDDTKENRKQRRAAMKRANADKNNYIAFATPYLDAVRTLELYNGYHDLDRIIADYEEVKRQRQAQHDAERAKQEQLAAMRKLDKERYTAQKRIGKR